MVIGHDFHFGRGREGNPGRMAELCRERGLDCLVAPAVVEGTEPVSSSAIRAALEAGDIAAANRLLGYRWFVRAEVRHGDKRGRVLGYPTANMRLPDDCRLRHGIYAVRASVGRQVDRRRRQFRPPPDLRQRRAASRGVSLRLLRRSLRPDIDVEFVGWIRGEETLRQHRGADRADGPGFGRGEADACRGQDGVDDRLIVQVSSRTKRSEDPGSLLE